MQITNNLLLIAEMFPYFTRGSHIKNKFSIILATLFNKAFTITFKNNISYQIELYDYKMIIHLLAIEKYAQIFDGSKSNVEISFDGDNRFYISKNKFTKEDKRLIFLLSFGITSGAIFLDKDHDVSIKSEKIVKIIQNNRSIIKTAEGVKFFLDSIGPEAIVETFVRRIHDQYSHDLKDKTVIDVGASIGDTPLYFASKGARVYAFEITKTNYDRMIENLELNPNLSKMITPVHTAIGKDGIVEFNETVYEDDFEGGASFVVNKYGKNSIKSQVAGMTIKTILKKFDIDLVSLLKLDCKGCEFF